MKKNLLANVFKWFSVVLAVIIVGYYAINVIEALQARPGSIACEDMIPCDNPFGGSLVWTFAVVVFAGWPVLALWVIVGLAALMQKLMRKQAAKTANLSKGEK